MSHIEYIHSECQKMIRDLQIYLNIKGHKSVEKHCGQFLDQMVDLIMLTTVWPNKPHLKILEIGFNAGHSAMAFLMNPTALVTSIDVGAHSYALDAKAFIDNHAPKKHTLIIGDSRQVLPNYIRDHPDDKFDIIFIDGGHDYEISKSDLDNCLKMCHSGTIIIMDDVVPLSMGPLYEWTVGPSRAWWEALSIKRVEQINKSHYGPGRGMVWGKKTSP